ncbi:hypothetical protein [Trinickia mobilis]|uniref:hypothetical protein n=1 Tax=Trinickia mobilis TaxID=2816356 RepID=UPI001A8EF5B1|nr:hypothetical protein [Trinickia mobilis]
MILDLEDSAPPELKADALRMAKESAVFLKQAGIAAFVSINGLEEGGIVELAERTLAEGRRYGIEIGTGGGAA